MNDKEKQNVDESIDEMMAEELDKEEAPCPASEEVTDCECDKEDNLSLEQKDEVDWQDKYIRLHAEWDNYRKRMEEQRAQERILATEKLMSDLLPLFDDFIRCLDFVDDGQVNGLSDGIKAIFTKFNDCLTKHGLEVIDPINEQFDPLECSAVGTKENKDVYDETVLEVYQKGYRLGIKVLRPAMVVISSGGKKRSEDSED